MKTEVLYTVESFNRFVAKLRDKGVRFDAYSSYDHDVELSCWVVDYEDAYKKGEA